MVLGAGVGGGSGGGGGRGGMCWRGYNETFLK